MSAALSGFSLMPLWVETGQKALMSPAGIAIMQTVRSVTLPQARGSDQYSTLPLTEMASLTQGQLSLSLALARCNIAKQGSLTSALRS